MPIPSKASTRFTPADLRRLLEYDAQTGRLSWKPRTIDLWQKFSPKGTERFCESWNVRYAGREAFIALNDGGYLQGCIFNTYLLAHRVAWAIHYGKWPAEEVGHRNGERTDNRIRNLRDATHRQNARNAHRSRRNRSGVTGVCWNKRRSKWAASISVEGQTRQLGLFETVADAATARREAEKAEGFGSRHGSERQSPDYYVPKSQRTLATGRC